MKKVFKRWKNEFDVSQYQRAGFWGDGDFMYEQVDATGRSGGILSFLDMQLTNELSTLNHKQLTVFKI